MVLHQRPAMAVMLQTITRRRIPIIKLPISLQLVSHVILSQHGLHQRLITMCSISAFIVVSIEENGHYALNAILMQAILAFLPALIVTNTTIKPKWITTIKEKVVIYIHRLLVMIAIKKYNKA